MVLASRRRALAVAAANSPTSRRVPSSRRRTARTSARSKLCSSPPSEAMTSACVTVAGFCGSGCVRRSSTVRTEPEAVRPPEVVTATRAPCN